MEPVADVQRPLILPTITCPPTRIAPELPAEQNASASPLHHIHADHDGRIFLRADRIDRRFLRLDDLSRIDNLDLFFLICMLFNSSDTTSSLPIRKI